MVNCAVPLCNSNGRNCKKSLSFHQFPCDDKRREIWLMNIAREGDTKGSLWIPSQYATVCGLHFTENDYQPGMKRKILKIDAAPTVFPSYPEFHKSRLRTSSFSPICHKMKVAENKNEIPDAKISKGMSSKDKGDEDVSRFALDGVVAEMVIEVEENEQNSTKPSNVKKAQKDNDLKSSALTLQSNEDSEHVLSSATKNDDVMEKENSETHEATLAEEVEETPSKMDTCGLESTETLKESEDSAEDNDDNDIDEENIRNEEKGLKSANETPGQIKKLRGRPKKKTSEELKKEMLKESEDSAEDNDDNDIGEENKRNEEKKLRGRPKKKTSEEFKKETRQTKADANVKSEDEAKSSQLQTSTSALKSKSSQSSATTSLKRTNEAEISSEDKKDEVPKKKLRSSPEENTPKRPKRSVTFSPVATEVDLTKRQSLRTTTILKAAQTPTKAIPASGKEKPISTTLRSTLKAWDLEPGRIYRLDDFIKIRNQVSRAEVKVLKCLHNILFNKVLPKDVRGKDLRKEIMKFKGYSFKKGSDEYKKHQSILEKMPDSTVADIVRVLDRKDKDISNIMSFLLKPCKQIYCEMDPFHPSLQPDLKLQKITLDTFSAGDPSDDSSNNEPFSSEDTLATSKRKRFPSTKLRFYDDFDLPASKKKSQETGKPSSTSTSVKKLSASTVAMKAASFKAQKAKQVGIKKPTFKARIAPRRKPQPKYMKQPLQVGLVKKPISSDLQVRRRALELAIEIQETVSHTEEEDDFELNENDESALESFEYESEIKEEVVTEDESENKEQSVPSIPDTTEDNESKSESEVTLSADEAKEATHDETPQKKRYHKPTVIPLKSYPSIKENIIKSGYSALQRLHIVLFGAPNKASNLKNNLLSFGGFPFYEGSEEWKQKEFLLSLLSQNTLKEYLDILDIKYRDGNQRLLIKKLMKFCAAPIEKLPDDVDDDEADDDMEMEVVSLEEIGPIETYTPEPPKAKKRPAALPKKILRKPQKPVPEKKERRYRKVLMDEAQVRRLEADLAREQRILEREKKLHEDQYVQAKTIRLSQQWNKTKPVEIGGAITKPAAENQTDTELLNALMETVYQRRELKKAGAKVSIPNKGGHTRLGELANVKFLVVTANYNDLDVLHHLIYMTEATKSRVRKNILDFAGFNFTEASAAYQDRMNFLTSLGYDISRRIAFLLGLCPYKTLIAEQDLNELIMYFLMSPCQSKQVPIRHMPNTFFGNDMPVELSALVEKHSGDLPVSPVHESTPRLSNKAKNTLQVTASGHQPSPSQGQKSSGPKARKSFKSSFNSSKMRGLTPSISTLPLKTPEKLLNPVSQSLTAAQPTARLFAQHTIKLPTTPQGVPAQEFYIQQQTADGQQKTFKLVKLPANHPLTNVLKNQVVLPATPEAQPQPIAIAPPVIGAPGLPPGLIVFKNSPTNPALSSVMQTVPLAIGQSTESTTINPLLVQNVPGLKPLLPKSADNSPVAVPKPTEGRGEVLPEEKQLSVPVECKYSSDEAEELSPLEEGNPPADEEIYDCIQDIIHSCPSLEDITLRNVISRVSAKYPTFDLTPQHYFMKECVKKIIMGT